jgi:hypothetical protein
MRHKARITAILLLFALLISPHSVPSLSAQTTSFAPDQLDQLLAPIALYPDSLLSQITTASTNPQEILDVNTWLQRNRGVQGAALTGAAEKEGFDPAFIALVNFPEILQTMVEHIDDYAALGEAFLSDQGAVAASIQRLRAQAYESGTLRSNAQQQVLIQKPAGQTIYVIQPASPQVVYVPQYDPAVVYAPFGSATVVTSPVISFGVGIRIGALLVDNRPWGWNGWGWDWAGRHAYYNRGYWRGWPSPYRSPYYFYRPRPIVWRNRPGYGGDWRYRPPNYRPPARPIHRPGYGSGKPPSSPRPAPPSKPGTPHKPSPPTTTPVRPGVPSPPRNGKPSTPGQPSRPSERSSKPGSPSVSRSSRPAPGGKAPAAPTQPKGPSPQSKDPIRTGANRLSTPKAPKSSDPNQLAATRNF